MSQFELLLAAAIVVFVIVYWIARRSTGIVARRGMSIGADLGALAASEKVRVDRAEIVGPGRVHVVLTADGSDIDAQAGLDVVVALDGGDFGYELLRRWESDRACLGVVIPPGSRIIRLRATDDLQPLTLRRIDT